MLAPPHRAAAVRGCGRLLPARRASSCAAAAPAAPSPPPAAAAAAAAAEPGGAAAAAAAVFAASAPGAATAAPPLVRTLWWRWRGQDVRYRACGASGPLVVLVHGFGASADQWPGHAALAASGHRVFAVDLLGFGYSSKPDPMGLPPNTVYNFATWGSQLADFVAHVGAGEPAFFVANSVGGVAALQAAVDAPGLVRGVVLLSVSLRGLHVTKQPPALRPLVAAFQRLLRTTPLGPALFAQIAQRDAVRSVLLQAFAVKAAVTDELVDAILAPAFLPGAAAVFLDFVSNSYGPLAEDLLPCCACPVLTVWGEEDPWELASLARGLYTPEAVPGVVERFVALPGVGHCPQSEAPDRVNGLVVDFVARHHAAARAAAAAATGGAPPPSLPAGV